MDNLRLGTTVRTLRIRRGWRQDDLAAATNVSRAQIGRIEHGQADAIQLRTLRHVCAALEIRVDLVPRWRGADLDRMLSSRHAVLAESVVEALRRDSPEWQVFPEVSFSIWGERGVIDLLAWHPGRRALLVIELKTELVDVGETLGTMDRKQRLAAQIAAECGWDAGTVSGWIILAAGRTNERRLATFRSTLRAAYPADARQAGAWLRDPVGSVAALSIWHEAAPRSNQTGSTKLGGVQRVRRRSPTATARPAHGTPPKRNSPER
jgi:transcriptional regulator with XRE-family HTH domain